MLGRADEFGSALTALAPTAGGPPSFVFRLGYATGGAPPSPRRPLSDRFSRRFGAHHRLPAADECQRPTPDGSHLDRFEAGVLEHLADALGVIPACAEPYDAEDMPETLPRGRAEIHGEYAAGRLQHAPNLRQA